MLKFTKIYNSNSQVISYEYVPINSNETIPEITNFKKNIVCLDKHFTTNDDIITNIIQSLSTKKDSYYEVSNYNEFDIFPCLYWVQNSKPLFIITSSKLLPIILKSFFNGFIGIPNAKLEYGVEPVGVKYIIDELCNNKIFVFNGEVDVYINEDNMYNYILKLDFNIIEIFCKREYLKERILSLK